MADKFYTIMVMGGASSKIKKFSVRKDFIKWLGISGAFFFMFGAFFIYNYSVMLERLNNVKPVASEAKVVITKVDDFRLRRLTHSLDLIKRNLQDMQKVSTKFRVMVGLQQDLDKHQLSGIGGNENPFRKASVFRGNKLLDEMLKDIENMKIGTFKQKSKMSELLDVMEDRRDVLASTPSIWPTRGWIASSFGMRSSPFTKKREFHRGVDISVAKGTIVRAPADGIVTFSGMKGSLGKAVEVNHGFGISTVYGHNSKLLVREGQRVTRGEPISRVGSTGRSTGPHLHYEIRVAGVRVNPRKYMLD